MSGPLLDGTVKGWPALGIPASAVAGAGLRVADLPTPALLLDETALEANVGAMAAWCAERRVQLAPHGKTTMCPAIFDRQLAAGAWGITVADARQARVAIAAGARRVLVANELLAPAALGELAAAFAEVTVCVDSLAGIRAAEAAPAAAPLRALVEVGHAGGRCGAREGADAVALARAIAASGRLELAGVEAFEGLLGERGDPAADAAVDAFLDEVGAVAREIASARIPLATEPVLSVGGSAFFDRVVERLGPVADELGWTLLLRSGCYVTHDHGLYARAADGRATGGAHGGPVLEAALRVRTRVLSRPEPGLAVLDAGRRDLSYDSGLPVVLGAPGAGPVRALSDQHAMAVLDPASPLAAGDIVELGISHPCTTLERWRVLALTGRDGSVRDALTTSF